MVNKYFHRCFFNKDNPYYPVIMKLIDESFSYRNSAPYLQRHYVVPKMWFKENNIEMDYSDDNMVYLTPMKYLRMQLLMYYYFRVIGNQNLMYRQFMVIYYLSRRASEELKAFGDIRKETYLEYNKRKIEYLIANPKKMEKIKITHQYPQADATPDL